MIAWGGGIDIVFVDNNPKSWDTILSLEIGDKSLSFDIKNPNELKNMKFDKLMLTSIMYYDDVIKQVLDYGIPKIKIDDSEAKLHTLPRRFFLKRFAQLYRNIEGNMAEVGVFRGEFAKKINEYFSDKKLYLFDTFEGFDDKDLRYEDNSEKHKNNNFTNTSLELVMGKMPHKENVIIKKGYFPQSVMDDKNLENERFCFVSLDTDLYKPILEGLDFFYPKMVKGGVIVIDDYYSQLYTGVKKAVDEFCKKYNVNILPIGDELSVSLQKQF
ncbi:TylF/MycF/NovP-related O-methyltransferase [Campylobacter sp. VTCC 70190]|uniref:TylF/MycF/NovP-related O-methyltransferase n=1 Tax=Campylobacter sp. VTCC 70190 TaxID=3392118 RepID=UPI00398F0422